MATATQLQPHHHHSGQTFRRRGRRLERKPCPIEGCGLLTPGGGLCNACRSWDRRVQRMSRSHLVEYAHRLERFAGRSRYLPSHTPRGIRIKPAAVRKAA